MSALAIYLLCVAVIIVCATATYWLDRVIVLVLRPGAFPDASRLAVSLERDTNEWRFTDGSAEHQSIGTIRAPDSAWSLHMPLKLGNDAIDWRPGYIERRIIWNALMDARSRVIHAHLDRALPT
jgi:hypothetical protein